MRHVLISLLALSQTACAYTVVSTGTLIATDKTLTDHMASTLAQADCNAVHVITRGSYYCEQRDIGKTYVRQLKP